MADIIHLLPDSVANQIAAGEVVQRPASAVKELLENTIDAGASEITVIIKEAGKSLIQVVDNGCGMSECDARMCFERHATSKIHQADDLLAIRTLGFRGEALASIASIAQVELKTKRVEDEIGTSILIEGTKLINQSPVSCPNGTSLSIKNLFYNVPARRNFLKSNTLELKYIIEEFFRVAMVNPDISFTFFNQDKILYKILPSNLKQRIVNLFGNSFTQRLIPIEQQTALVNLSGFIGKPEFAKKNRGEQYFFTNGRFMKSPYLHHAVENAFQELITKDSFPTYFIFLEVDPKTIDVNIHPTKTEINFLDIKSIYAILHAAIKQAIGKFNLSPSLDFEVEQSMILPPLQPNQQIRPPTITINPDYNPFEKKANPIPAPHSTSMHRATIEAWSQFNQPIEEDIAPKKTPCFQIENSFIITQSKTGIVVIDQQNAHERILFERLLDRTVADEISVQRLLIPITLHLSPNDLLFFQAWKEQFDKLGFEISDFGNDDLLIHSIPSTVGNIPSEGFFETILESLKGHPPDIKSDHANILARTMAKKLAIKRGTKLHLLEMETLVENLFACKIPEISPDGKLTMTILSFEELRKKFKY
ncbi:MAG: DNA mismatch repair endonuclease MutL [Bacteroidales bacterium]|nr:DNA mismatch repair endonuclease MutL [Bacteroidales bacterium]MDD4604031.1 DNA mismatch repair endonuclease MutL [Bacteroidales bacterium]